MRVPVIGLPAAHYRRYDYEQKVVSFDEVVQGRTRDLYVTLHKPCGDQNNPGRDRIIVTKAVSNTTYQELHHEP